MVYYNVQDPFKVDMHVACASYQSNQTEKGKKKILVSIVAGKTPQAFLIRVLADLHS